MVNSFFITVVAASEDDYTPSGSLTVTFEFSNAMDRSECADINTLDDEALEGDHYFTVSVGSVTPSNVLTGTPSSVIIPLLDNDGKIHTTTTIIYKTLLFHLYLFNQLQILLLRCPICFKR